MILGLHSVSYKQLLNLFVIETKLDMKKISKTKIIKTVDKSYVK